MCISSNFKYFFKKIKIIYKKGFASGDPNKDAAAFRYFVNEGHQVLVAQSYAKNFGLYGNKEIHTNILYK